MMFDTGVVGAGVIAVVVIILAVIIGVVYLVRFFLNPN